MVTKENILDLLRYGERINFECKKANYRTLYGRPTHLLRIQKAALFYLGLKSM